MNQRTGSSLILDMKWCLTAAFMVMLGSRGLLIPGLDDSIGGQEKHGPLPLELPELLLLSRLIRCGCSSTAELIEEVCRETGSERDRLVEMVAKLLARDLLIDSSLEPTGPQAEVVCERPAHPLGSTIPELLAVSTPRLFRLSAGGYEHIDDFGRLQAQLSAVELVALSGFVQPISVSAALSQHQRACGQLALDEDRFLSLVHRLRTLGLLLNMSSQDSQAHSWLDGRPAISRDGFRVVSDLMRDAAAECENAENQFQELTGRKRIKVVSVQENGTIFPLGLGVIVAYAKAYQGGWLNDHYYFHPDWLVRPSKVRALTQEPGVFLFSNYNWSHRHNLLVSKKVKQVSPWSVTIHGGPNTPKYKGDSDAYFREHPDVDITVRGEGEVAVAELLSAIKDHVGKGPLAPATLREIPGISFRDGANVVHTPERPRIADLDSIPSPILSGLFDAYRERTELGIIESNRGCPYTCSFCDWGSATNSRIRKFSIDRVFAELEWCARHKVDGIMCADANFGIFERDVDIALKVASLKQEFGYPNSFSTNYAKNTTTYLKRIIEILNDVGVITTGTIAVQTLDRNTLVSIKRSNIKLSQYDNLATEFHKAGLPLIMDLMYGLPGQTFVTFQNDLQECINRGVFPRMYMTELLVNSPMNEQGYRELHNIQSEPSPDGSRHFVVSSTTFSRQEYDDMNGLRRVFALCYVFGMLREVAHYVRSETGRREIDFYEQLRRDLKDFPEEWPILTFAVRALPAILVSPAGWHIVIEDARKYLTERLGLADDSALSSVLAVQRALLPGKGRAEPKTLELAHDYGAWHLAMVEAKESGRQSDWQEVVPRLRKFEPGTFSPKDREQIGTFGLSPALFGVQNPALTY